mmetsp:Transcript_45093/g.143610  ORF Transcript_45093/g.143610 Transcript_45093/m.143610 type:complete len:364 (-) Transcript_45093:170-1261(-)
MPRYRLLGTGAGLLGVVVVALLFADSFAAKGKPSCIPEQANRPDILRMKGLGAIKKNPWYKLHSELAQDAAGDAALKTDVLFLGDSITETFRGTSMGNLCMRCSGVEGVVESHYRKWNPMFLGISGDTSWDLAWRISSAGGELGYGTLSPKAVVILIGTNDFGKCMFDAEQAIEGIKAVASTVRSALPSAEVVVVALLPRADDLCSSRSWRKPGKKGRRWNAPPGGGGAGRSSSMRPNTWQQGSARPHRQLLQGGPKAQWWGHPGRPTAEASRTHMCQEGPDLPLSESKYTPLLAHTNAAVREWAGREQRVRFVDCESIFIVERAGEKHLVKRTMPDWLHPGREGMLAYSKCIGPVLDEILGL